MDVFLAKEIHISYCIIIATICDIKRPCISISHCNKPIIITEHHLIYYFVFISAYNSSLITFNTADNKVAGSSQWQRTKIFDCFIVAFGC